MYSLVTCGFLSDVTDKGSKILGTVAFARIGGPPGLPADVRGGVTCTSRRGKRRHDRATATSMKHARSFPRELALAFSFTALGGVIPRRESPSSHAPPRRARMH